MVIGICLTVLGLLTANIVIQAPPNSGYDYYNYKGDFSIVLMALCDANYCFTIVDKGAKGRQSDGGIFRNSALGQMLFSNLLDLPDAREIVEGEEPIPYFMVADEAFPLNINIMRSYPRRFLSQEKRVFNYRLSRARRVIENTFGILAAVCLHNFLKKKDNSKEDERRYCPNNLIDREDEDGYIIEGDWRLEPNNLQRIGQFGGNAYGRNAANVREVLTEYFMYESPIEPQWYK